MEIDLIGKKFFLYPEKGMLWMEKEMLIVADLHIGKTSHFRKSGIAIPFNAELNNLRQLERLILKSQCKEIVFLGDMFHSLHNYDCEKFIRWRNNFPTIKMTLIEGNHDILDPEFYHCAGLQVHESLIHEPFIFTHKPLRINDSSRHYNLAGHIHPGVKLYGKARQSVSLSCFHFGKKSGILPSFGAFTGNCIITPQNEDQIYVVAENNIHRII